MLYLAIRSMVAIKKLRDDNQPNQINQFLYIGSIGAALKLNVLM